MQYLCSKCGTHTNGIKKNVFVEEMAKKGFGVRVLNWKQNKNGQLCWATNHTTEGIKATHSTCHIWNAYYIIIHWNDSFLKKVYTHTHTHTITTHETATKPATKEKSPENNHAKDTSRVWRESLSYVNNWSIRNVYICATMHIIISWQFVRKFQAFSALSTHCVISHPSHGIMSRKWRLRRVTDITMYRKTFNQNI